MGPQIYMLQGVSGTGKTTVCLELYRRLLRLKHEIGGIICPPVFINGVKTAINVLNLRSGEELFLAGRENVTGEVARTTRWRFTAEGMGHGELAIKQSVPCDILFIDEIGPLELERSEGWVLALDVLRERNYKAAIVTSRPELTRVYSEAVGGAIPVDISQDHDISKQTIDEMIQTLAKSI